jgi:hypothetical protein
MQSKIVILGSKQSTHVFAEIRSNSYFYTSCLYVLLLLLLLLLVVVVVVVEETITTRNGVP